MKLTLGQKCVNRPAVSWTLGDKSDDAISETKSLNDEYDELVLPPSSESEPLSSVGCDTLCCKLRNAPFNELPSSQTGNRIGVS